MDATILSRIQSAGFGLEVEGGTLFVSPSDRLTDKQRQFLKAHKPQLLAALAARPVAADTAMPSADDCQHAQEANLPLMPTTFAGIGVRCADCRHAIADDYHPALVTCAAGRVAVAACGSFWALDVRTCARFEAITTATSTSASTTNPAEAAA